MRIFGCSIFRKRLFERRDDPDYQPLPEADRPGGFNFGEQVQDDADDAR